MANHALVVSVFAAILCLSSSAELISAESIAGLNVEDPYGGGQPKPHPHPTPKPKPHPQPHHPQPKPQPHPQPQPQPHTPHTPKPTPPPHPTQPNTKHPINHPTPKTPPPIMSHTGVNGTHRKPTPLPTPTPTHKTPKPVQQPTPVSDSLASLGYQQATALRYLFYSYATYCSANDITNWNCRWCSGSDAQLSSVSTVSASEQDAFGFIGYNAAHNEIVVAYRGTQPTSLTNWITDLSFAKTDLNFAGLSGAHVHSGFYDNYNALSAQTKAAVAALRASYPSASVYFTGHSLGGAMATLATLDAAVTWKIPASSLGHMTYGSPRVGDATFASAFTQYVGAGNHLRMVNDDDLVPHLPLKSMGFHHISTEVWLHGDSAQVCNSSGEDPSCSDSALGISVYDHIHYFGYLQIC